MNDSTQSEQRIFITVFKGNYNALRRGRKKIKLATQDHSNKNTNTKETSNDMNQQLL